MTNEPYNQPTCQAVSPYAPQIPHSPSPKSRRQFPPRSVFNTAHKRCNSNERTLTFERLTWELHAKLRGAHRTTVPHSATSSARASPQLAAPEHPPQRLNTHTEPPRHARTHKTAPASSHGDRGRGRGWLGRRARKRLLLDAAGGQAGDDVLLQVLEQQDHRDGRDHGAGREDAPRGDLRVGRPHVHADG